MVQCRCERHTHTDWSIEGRAFKTRELTIEAFAQGATPRGQRDRVNQPYQDRHLMNTQPPFGKAARRARRSSTGHGGTHPDFPLSSPIDRHLIAFDAAYRSFIGRVAVAQLAASVRTQSVSSPAALKSP